MEDSILTSTKKVLGIAEEYTAFDEDIIMHINSAFSTLNQLGFGINGGFQIEDAAPTWNLFTDSVAHLNMIKTYVFLKVRMLFDPPTTSFLIEAFNKQIEQHEFRLSVFREYELASEGISG